jgi:pimeloyl-ACP methyl ester carboxylesterase
MFSGWLKSALGALILGFVTISVASAQMRLEPAYPDLKGLGPDAAKGAIVWSHGRSVNSEDSLSPTPYYVAVLRDAGWDAFRFNRMRDGDTLQDSSRELVRQVEALRQRGYQKVVLAGQSFGAFLSLMAADASDDVHAVIATAPAAYGSFSEYYDSWRNNATYLYPLLEKVRHARVMLFFFHGDEFDPGGRGERSNSILASHRIDHLIVDQPRSLMGHWAASTGLFVRRFGACIRDFLDAPRIDSQMDCDDSWGMKPSAQLPVPATIVPTSSGRGLAADNAFYGKWYGFYPNGREVLLAVEKVKGDDVTAIYALGPGIQDGQSAEWVRRNGRIVDDELLFKEKGRNTLRYRLRSDGKLEAAWISVDGKSTLDATLHRID